MLCDEPAEDEEGMEDPSPSKRPSVLTIDRAAFLLLRVKRAFKKKRQQRKEKNAAAAAAEALGASCPRRGPPPLLRSRTLPAIIVPGFSILHAQIDPNRNNDVSQSLSRGLSTHKVGGLRAQTPRISFTSKDDEASDTRRKSTSSRLSCSPRSSITSDDRTDGSILRVPGTTPRGSVSSTGSGSSRLSRLLSQTVRSSPQENDTARRLSWERRDSSGQLPRSASIDSIVEAVLSCRRSVPVCTPLAVPIARTDRALSLVSPAVGRRAKTQRGLAAARAGDRRARRMPCSPTEPRDMDTLLDKLKKDHGSLRRTRSVRASLRMIGNRWRSIKDENEDLELLKRNTAIFSSQIWKTSEVETRIEGAYVLRSPTMAKKKLESKQRRKSGDIDLVLKPQKNGKVEKSKLSDLFSNKKYKSYSAKELSIPTEVPPKAAALLHIHSPGKGKKKLKGMGKSESTKSMSDLVVPQRQRRGSESDMGVEARGCVNHAFVYSTPPKDRRKLASPTGYMKLQYGALLEGCGGDRGSLTACSPHNPHPEKLRRRIRDDARLPTDNIHLHALFAAVEHGHIDKARNILESTDVDVNSQNSDCLTPLDVAVLANNRQLARMLMEFGAKEGSQFSSSEELGAHLRKLAREAESRLLEVTGCASDKACRDDVTRSSASGVAGTTGCAGGTTSEKDKQAQHWERRVRALKRLVLGYQQTRPPSSPAPPELNVSGSHAVCVTLGPAHLHHLDPIITKYRVEWSSRADFGNICGRREVSGGAASSALVLSGLSRGRRYFVRASAGNLKGFGPSSVSRPRSVVPSCWRDLPTCVSRAGWAGQAGAALESLTSAAAAVRTRPQRQRKDKKTTIKQLFTPAIKFHKNLRRGVYLACLVYHEDKVLVTNEDCLPVVEVDETYPTCIYTDFHWLMKVSCSWEEVKNLRCDMEKHSSSSLHFRLKLLTAVAQMQSALCQQDLGTVYHKPLRDRHGTVVISCIVPGRTARGPAGCRWTNYNRIRRRGISDDDCATELLLASLHAHLQYQQACHTRLPRGLYVGYLKLQSSVEVVRVVVPAATPNVPPHVRLRDNPHVSAEEWDYLKSQSLPAPSESNHALTIPPDKMPSESQEIFLDCLSKAARKLFKDMEIPLDAAITHRIYDLEVIELNSDVSFIMICPPAELACSVPGQKEILLQRGDLLSLPLQAFEMIHLQTYHSSVLTKYTKLSCMLELDVTLAAHTQREAFSCSELQVAKEKLTKLEELQNNLNTVWKSERWLMDLISFARDKDKTGPASGVLIKYVLDKMPANMSADRNHDKDVNLKVDLLQIPSRDGKIKSSPGRGSWPGPAGNGHQNLNHELSKSEQQLSIPPRQSASSINLNTQFTNATSEHYEVYSSQRLPPSKSEDTLIHEPETVNYSTASSPLLTVKSCSGSMVSVKVGSNITESAQSLSSDSESQSCPISTYVPMKNRPQSKHRQVMSSKSMVNVKSDTFYTDTGQNLFKKDDGVVERVCKTEEVKEKVSEVNKISDQPGILQVFAAYETGLATGTSLKLHVTPRTTAREVIDLVVKQLNMAAVLKGKSGPVYGPERLQDFCLVAVIGARERCLRDDFKPLQLQNPWRKGRLYVRLKHDVLAALNHSAKQPAFI